MPSNNEQHQQQQTISISERRFLDDLQHNLNHLASESKRKFPHIKEACETGIIRIRNIASSTSKINLKSTITNESAQLMEPFFMGCDTKWPKLVQISLNTIQKIILFQCLNKQAAENLINSLWNLMEQSLEEVKVLQTITLLITANQLIQHGQLAKILSLCFRLHNAKNSTTANTASATIRQLITAIFERIVCNENDEQNRNHDEIHKQIDKSKLFNIIIMNDQKTHDSCHQYVPIRFQTMPSCMDAYDLMQDLLQIINGEKTFWLKLSGIDVGKLFALELLELIIDHYSSIFFEYDEFTFILKDKVCQVVIKLFAPNIKAIRSNNRHLLQNNNNNNNNCNDANNNSSDISNNQSQTIQKMPPQWPTTVRLMRIVSILVKKYFKLLITENEIFLTQLTRLLEVDKSNWQRLIALESLHKILDVKTLLAFCEYYDSSLQSSKILRDILNSLCVFIQSQFLIIDSSTTQSLIASLVNNNNSGNFAGTISSSNNNNNSGNNNVINGQINRKNHQICDQHYPTFMLKNMMIELLFIPFDNDNRYKTFYIEQLDKQEPPQAPNGHALSTGIACVFEIVSSLIKIIENYLEMSIDLKSAANLNDIKSKIQTKNVETFKLHQQLILSTYTGLIGSFSLLIDASADEKCTELILEQMQKLIIIYGLYGVNVARDLMMISLCKSALPLNYYPLRALNPDNIISAIQTIDQSSNDDVNSANKLSTNSNASSIASANLYSSTNIISNTTINLANLLQQQNNHPQPINSNKSSLEATTSANNSATNYQNEYNRQVIAVGTPLPVNSNNISLLNNNQSNNNQLQQQQQQQHQQNNGPVMLTAKNIQCMRTIMQISMTYGGLYHEQTWYIVFTTLQHLVWILDIKPNNSKTSQYYQQPLVEDTQTSQSSDLINNTSIPVTSSTSANDLPVLTAMLSRLFECTHHDTISENLSSIFLNTQNIDDDSLLTMIKALITISNEAMEIAYNNREPSMFAIVKMHESAMVNLARIDLFWELITNHLIQISSHPYNKLRENAVEVVCNLVQSILNYQFMKRKNVNDVNDDVQCKSSSESYYLMALQSLSMIKFIDIRQKQIGCLLRILQTNGEDITIGWPILFNIIESACIPQNDKLIKHSFQCYEFIVSNLLHYIPSIHLIHCVNAAVAFGSQIQDLNVSLSAVGLVWNVADFLHSNNEQIQTSINEYLRNGHKFVSVDLPFCENLTPIQSLWISLFKNLSNLCTDARLSVRKSSVQTLMSTLSKHGQSLDLNTWKAIFFYILFPLVESVRTLCGVASNEKITQSESSIGDDSDSYMIHYSRNTAFKQWCETQVSVIGGTSRIVSMKLDMLIEHIRQDLLSKESNKNNNETILINIWTLFLENLYSSSTFANEEVSMSSIKCFSEIVNFLNEYQINKHNDNENNGNNDDHINELMNSIWENVWKTWCNIGNQISSNKFCIINNDNCYETNETKTTNGQSNFIPSQTYLCLFIQPLYIIFSKNIHSLTESDFKNMSNILQNVMLIPFDVLTETYHHAVSYRNNHHQHHHHHSHHHHQHFHHHHNHSSIISSADNSSTPTLLTSLQHEIMITMEKIQGRIIQNLPKTSHLLPLVYYQYLNFSLYAVNIVPPNINVFISKQFQHRFLPGELTQFKSPTFYIFGEISLRNAFNLYMCTNSEPIVIKSNILHSLIKSYKIPLCFKYSCPLQTTWKYAVNYFIKTLEIGLPLARRFPSDFISIWADLALTFEGFLFPSNKPPTNQKLEDQQIDESLDVKVVELIRDHIMIYAQKIPKEFLLQIVSILNRGSIHSPSITSIETEMNRKLREDFARICFQTLLQFSFFGPKGNPDLFIQSSKTNLNLAENNGQTANEHQTIGIVNKLAVASILKRFNDVIIKYVEDEQLCPCPLPRHRLSEISFVLKALATLIASLKEAPQSAVEEHVWQQLINLYPRIVDCTMSNSPQVNNSIREVLHQYAYLLQCPKISPNELNGENQCNHNQMVQHHLMNKSITENNNNLKMTNENMKNFQQNAEIDI